MTDIEKARKLLSETGASLAAVADDEIYLSHKRGVAPILDKIDENPNFFNGASVADKVIGRAAAMLLSGHSVRAIHASVISQKALDYLQSKAVEVTFDEKTAFIVNRDGTGMCPMEQVTDGISSEAEAEAAIRKRLAELNG